MKKNGDFGPSLYGYFITAGDFQDWIYMKPIGKCFNPENKKTSTRWAPASYKWGYNPYEWPYNSVTGVRVVTQVTSGRGPILYQFDHFLDANLPKQNTLHLKSMMTKCNNSGSKSWFWIINKPKTHLNQNPAKTPGKNWFTHFFKRDFSFFLTRNQKTKTKPPKNESATLEIHQVFESWHSEREETDDFCRPFL